MLTKLQTQLQLCDQTFEYVNEDVGRLLHTFNNYKSKSECEEEYESKIQDSSILEIEITKSTTTDEEMRSFADEFNNLISNDMLVKEEKVDILIEKVQLLHTCIDSLKMKSIHILQQLQINMQSSMINYKAFDHKIKYCQIYTRPN